MKMSMTMDPIQKKQNVFESVQYVVEKLVTPIWKMKMSMTESDSKQAKRKRSRKPTVHRRKTVKKINQEKENKVFKNSPICKNAGLNGNNHTRG